MVMAVFFFDIGENGRAFLGRLTDVNGRFEYRIINKKYYGCDWLPDHAMTEEEVIDFFNTFGWESHFRTKDKLYFRTAVVELINSEDAYSTW
jgi:hypothetical protein